MKLPSRLLRLFSFAVIDQALLSAANFLMAFLIIRHTTGADYGVFVLVQTTVMMAVVAQGSWLSGPLFVLLPKKTPERRAEMVGAIGGSQRRMLRRLVAVGMLVPPLGCAGGFWDAGAALIGFLALFAGWATLLREYNRVVLLCYGRSQTLLSLDTVYAALLIVAAVAAVFAPRELSLGGAPIHVPAAAWAVLALAASAGIGGHVAFRALAKNPGWHDADDARPYWRELRPLAVWSAAGAAVYWLFSQSYNYVIASSIGLEAVADVNATRLLLMPAVLITVGVKGLLTPSASSWLIESGITSVLRRLTLFVVGIAVLDLLYFAVVWLLRDWLTTGLMRRTIADLDRLLLLWLCMALLGLARDIYMTALQALERFKVVAMLTGVGAVISLSIMWFALQRWGAAGTLIGQIVGELVILTGMILLALQSNRRSKSALQTPPATIP